MTYGDRKSVRVRFESGVAATIIAIDGTWRLNCTVIDVSSTGARLKVDAASGAIPGNEFFLLLSSGGQVRRRCRRVRQLGEEIGIEFVRMRSAAATHRDGNSGRVATRR